MISTALKTSTSKPFITYDFFAQLENFFREYPELNEKKIYDCVKSGFLTDQTRGHVVSAMGQPVLKLSFGTRRENIIILGICSASGITCDALIISKDKNFMTSWFGEIALPNTYYVHLGNGWMYSVAFGSKYLQRP